VNHLAVCFKVLLFHVKVQLVPKVTLQAPRVNPPEAKVSVWYVHRDMLEVHG
jgi:hypothetical protein